MIVWGVILLLVLIGGWLRVQNVADQASNAAEKANDAAHAVHAAQVVNCEQNANPLRRVVRLAVAAIIDNVARQAAQSKSIPHSFFPNIPAAQYAKLQARAQRRAVREIRKLSRAKTRARRVPCHHQFKASRPSD